MSATWKTLAAKAVSVYAYIKIHHKQLSAAFALGAGLLEAYQKAH